MTLSALAISGSPRENGNTAILLRRCLDRLTTQGIGCELVSLSGKTIRGCIACGACSQTRDATCSGTTDDDFQPYFEKMVKADIIIVGSPVYFGSATPELMALLDRAGYVGRANGNLFSRKLGGTIAPEMRAKTREIGRDGRGGAKSRLSRGEYIFRGLKRYLTTPNECGEPAAGVVT